MIAASLMAGEYDFHHENIGIMDVGDNNYVFAKIDHGWSCSLLFTDPNKMLQSLGNAYVERGYSQYINFDIDKFMDAIEEIIQISEDEIKNHGCLLK